MALVRPRGRVRARKLKVHGKQGERTLAEIAKSGAAARQGKRKPIRSD